MKTAIEVVKETILNHPISMDNVEVEDFEDEEWSKILLPVLTDAMKAYALQACEDLRQRISEEAMVECLDFDKYRVDKESILEVEIILK